jgi:hypothetical protein
MVEYCMIGSVIEISKCRWDVCCQVFSYGLVLIAVDTIIACVIEVKPHNNVRYDFKLKRIIIIKSVFYIFNNFDNM